VITSGGKDYEVLMDEKFKTTKLSKMIFEGIENQKQLTDENVKISYYLFLMIKYFTDVEIETEDLAEQLAILNEMIDLGIYEQLTAAIPESEIKRASDFMLKLANKIKVMTEQKKSIEEVKEAIETEIENTDV
jgi:hypothetical protein